MLLPNTLFCFSFFNRWPENNHLFIITIYEDFFAAGILFFLCEHCLRTQKEGTSRSFFLPRLAANLVYLLTSTAGVPPPSSALVPQSSTSSGRTKLDSQRVAAGGVHTAAGSNTGAVSLLRAALAAYKA